MCLTDFIATYVIPSCVLRLWRRIRHPRSALARWRQLRWAKRLRVGDQVLYNNKPWYIAKVNDNLMAELSGGPKVDLLHECRPIEGLHNYKFELKEHYHR